MRNNNQILHSDQIRWKESFKGFATPPAMVKIFVTQMLTRDLFAVANLPGTCFMQPFFSSFAVALYDVRLTTRLINTNQLILSDSNCTDPDCINCV